MKKIEVKTPQYQTVQVGETIEIKWETSDGEQFADEKQATIHEFYTCKVNMRPCNLPFGNANAFDFESLEDLEKYELDYFYNDDVRKYKKEGLVFPSTYVIYEIEDPKFDYDDPNPYEEPERWIYCVTLEEYKQLLISEIDKLN